MYTETAEKICMIDGCAKNAGRLRNKPFQNLRWGHVICNYVQRGTREMNNQSRRGREVKEGDPSIPLREQCWLSVALLGGGRARESARNLEV